MAHPVQTMAVTDTCDVTGRLSADYSWAYDFCVLHELKQSVILKAPT